MRLSRLVAVILLALGPFLALHGAVGEILKEMMPRLGRVVTFCDPGNAISREGARRGREAVRQLRVQFAEPHVRSVEELRLGVAALEEAGDGCVLLHVGLGSHQLGRPDHRRRPGQEAADDVV